MAAAVVLPSEDLHGALARRRTPLLKTGSDEGLRPLRCIQGVEELMSQMLNLYLHVVSACKGGYEDDTLKLVRCDSSGATGLQKAFMQFLLPRSSNNVSV